MKRIVKHRKCILLFLMTFLFLAGIVWQAVMVDLESEKLTAVGQSVDTGTYRAHYYSKGNGDKVFVFITGAGTPCAYTDFYVLQNELSKSGQTITYDHAGIGWSTSTKAERSISNLVKELSVIINAAAPDKSIVFVLDVRKMIRDNIAVRDGLHLLKVKNCLPLADYLLAAISSEDFQEEMKWTPTLFTEKANQLFFDRYVYGSVAYKLE